MLNSRPASARDTDLGRHARSWTWVRRFCWLGVLTASWIALAGCTASVAKSTIVPSPHSASPPTITPPPNASLTPVLDAPAQEPTPGPLQLAVVAKVVDGDTVDVLVNGQRERLRLIGMDTPETVAPDRPIQCYGPEASAKAKALLTGQQVWIEADPSQGDRGKYGRYLRYLWMADGTLYDEMMIRQGYAHEYTYDTHYKYWNAFRAAEREAKAANRGFWSPSTCNGNTTQPEPKSLGSG